MKSSPFGDPATLPWGLHLRWRSGIPAPRVVFHLMLMLMLMLVLAGAEAMGGTNGSILGRVVYEDGGRPAHGAQVVVRGTRLGGIVREDGRYAVREVPPGTWTIVVSKIGFAPVETLMVVREATDHSFNARLAESTIDIAAVTVEAEPPYSSASSQSIRQLDLMLRPVRSSQDLLSMVPGLMIAQHAGGGKAEQIFLRGFDADHGTDVAIYADGMPVNMVSHGHGQGYADLHFLIPELVESVELEKGPYVARYGNLATAGAVSLRTRDHLEHNLAKVEGGMFGTARLTAAVEVPTGSEVFQGYVAGQAARTDGPFEAPQGFKRLNLLSRFHAHLSDRSRITATVSAFDSRWSASGQIPERAVAAGTIGRFGALDPLEGGTTGRNDLRIDYRTSGEESAEFSVQTYLSGYRFQLFSNFTYFLHDTLAGDMIEQTDDRLTAGVTTVYGVRGLIGGPLGRTTFGAGYRADVASVELWKSPERIRMTPYVLTDITEHNLMFWAEQEFFPVEAIRLKLGVRADGFAFKNSDRTPDPASDGTQDLMHSSGTVRAGIVSPKLGLAVTPAQGLDFFMNAGGGFHSNDARVVVAARQRGNAGAPGTLPRAWGGELGMRTSLVPSLLLSGSVWTLSMEEELVYVGDEGTTEASGATLRHGADLGARWQINDWLWADAEMAVSSGRFVDAPESEQEIPLAPRFTLTGGITVIHPSGLDASLRYRSIGDRPANESNTVQARGSTVLDLTVGYRLENIRLFAQLQNLLGTDWNEAQFDTESRLRGEPSSVSELHFTPGNPFNVQAGISVEM